MRTALRKALKPLADQLVRDLVDVIASRFEGCFDEAIDVARSALASTAEALLCPSSSATTEPVPAPSAPAPATRSARAARASTSAATRGATFAAAGTGASTTASARSRVTRTAGRTAGAAGRKRAADPGSELLAAALGPELAAALSSTTSRETAGAPRPTRASSSLPRASSPSPTPAPSLRSFSPDKPEIERPRRLDADRPTRGADRVEVIRPKRPEPARLTPDELEARRREILERRAREADELAAIEQRRAAAAAAAEPTEPSRVDVVAELPVPIASFEI